MMFVRRFIADYARNPVNLLLLTLVPVVFVGVAAGPLGDFAELLGGPAGPQVEAATTGWAAGFLAGIAMYFQIRAGRETDRRLVLAGLAPSRLVFARLVTGALLAVVASAAALLALAARRGIDAPWRVIAGTLMFAVIYLAIGAVIGVLARNPVNGTVLVMFLWILDVFFGPAMGAKDRLVTRGLPTHFVTLWMVDLPSRHGGRLGDLGLALAWLGAAVAAAFVIVAATSRVTGRRRRLIRAGSAFGQLTTGVRMAVRETRRNPALWALLVVVPVVYVLGSVLITPDEPSTMTVVEGGRKIAGTFSLLDVHAGTMAPIAIGSLAALAGLFIGLDARSADRRLVLAGARPGVVLAGRLTVIGLAAVVASGAALAVTVPVFDARQWSVYAASSLLIALTYGLIGVVLGPIFGRVGGVFIAFLVPFLDLGIGQSPMLRPDAPDWARLLPGYGAYRVLIDGGLTATFDTTGPLLLALAWLVGLGVLALLVFRHEMPNTRIRTHVGERRSL